MNLTRAFTFIGLIFVLISILAAGMGQFQFSAFLIGFVIIGGACLALWNWRR